MVSSLLKALLGGSNKKSSKKGGNDDLRAVAEFGKLAKQESNPETHKQRGREIERKMNRELNKKK